ALTCRCAADGGRRLLLIRTARVCPVALILYVADPHLIAAYRSGITRREDTRSHQVRRGATHFAGVVRAGVVVVADFGGTRVQLRCHNQVRAVALRPGPRVLKSLAGDLVVRALLPDPAGRDYQLVVDDMALDIYVNRPIDGARGGGEISTGVGGTGSV